MKEMVYIVPSLIKSGPINVLYNLVKHINREEYKPYIIALSDHSLKKRSNRKWFEDLGIEVQSYSFSKWFLQVKLSSAARMIEKRFRGRDVIFHAHGYYPTLLLAKMHVLCPRMTTIHNICDEDFVMRKGWLMGHYMSYKYKKALRKMNMCISICDSMEAYYAKDSLLKLQTVYNGVEVGRSYSEKRRDEWRNAMGIAPTSVVFLYPAAFSLRKNQRFIIEEVLRSKVRNILVVFAGQGEMEPECRKLAQNDSRFLFVGYQMDMAKYWAVADYMISSSLSEGLPMAVLESLLHGKPCLLSNIAPHREILTKVFGDNNGLLFDLQENALSNLFPEIIERKYNPETILERATSMYSAEAMAKGYERIYKRINNQ